MGKALVAGPLKKDRYFFAASLTALKANISSVYEEAGTDQLSEAELLQQQQLQQQQLQQQQLQQQKPEHQFSGFRDFKSFQVRKKYCVSRK